MNRCKICGCFYYIEKLIELKSSEYGCCYNCYDKFYSGWSECIANKRGEVFMKDFIDDEDVEEIKEEGGKFLKLLKSVLIDYLGKFFNFVLSKVFKKVG